MWKGVIIEESLEDQSILKKVDIVLRKESVLEDESGRGKFHFDKVQVSDEKIAEVIVLGKKAIKKGWYMHFCKGNEMVVIFRGIGFEHQKGNKTSLDAIHRYGKSVGVIAAQLPSDGLIEDPWG
jgi:uncharacterized protein (DUF2344 family)